MTFIDTAEAADAGRAERDRQRRSNAHWDHIRGEWVPGPVPDLPPAPRMRFDSIEATAPPAPAPKPAAAGDGLPDDWVVPDAAPTRAGGSDGLPDDWVTPDASPKAPEQSWADYIVPKSASPVVLATEAGKRFAEGVKETAVAGPLRGAAALAWNQPLSDQAGPLIDELEASATLTPAQRRAMRSRAAEILPLDVAFEFQKALFGIRDGADPRAATDAVRAAAQSYSQAQSSQPPIKEHPLYRAGEAVSEFGREALAPAPGFEQGKSLFADVAQGAGSLVSGLALSRVPVVGAAAAPSSYVLGGVGEAAQNAVKNNATDEQTYRAAQWGTYAGATDLADLLLPNLGSTGKVMGFLARVSTAALKGAFIEGGQEGVQQLMQNMIAKGIYKPDQDLTEDVAKNALVGAILGKVTGAVGAASEGRHPQGVPEGAASADTLYPEAAAQAPMEGEIIPPVAGALPPPAAPVRPGIAGPAPAMGAETLYGDGFAMQEGAPAPAAALPSPQSLAPEGFIPGEGFYAQDPAARPPRTVQRSGGEPFRQTVDATIAEPIITPAPAQGVTIPAGGVTNPAEITQQNQAAPPQSVTFPPESVVTPPPPPGRDLTAQDELQALLDDPRSLEEIKAEREGAANWQPTADWQEVPVGTPTFGLGLEFRTQDGKTFARLPPTPGTREAPIEIATPKDVHAGTPAVEPTPAQAAAGNYRKRHATWKGLDLTIETEAGQERTGIAPDGTPWSVTMPAPYGYVKGTRGRDGDQVDVYLGPNPEAGHVFVVDQVDPVTGKFDEHKAMLGFPNEAAALATYHAAFSDGSGQDRAGAVFPMTVAQFKAWVNGGNTRKPLAYSEPIAVKERAAPKPKGPYDIIQFLASRGGIRSDDPLAADLRQSFGGRNPFVPGFGPLIRPPGALSTAAQMGGKSPPMFLDRAREAAVEASYLQDLHGTSTVNDLLEAIDATARGNRVFSEHDMEEIARRDFERQAQERAAEFERAVADLKATAKSEGLIASDDDITLAVERALSEGSDPHEALIDVLERNALADESEQAENASDAESELPPQALDATGTDEARPEPPQASPVSEPDRSAESPQAQERGEHGEAERTPGQGADQVAAVLARHATRLTPEQFFDTANDGAQPRAGVITPNGQIHEFSQEYGREGEWKGKGAHARFFAETGVRLPQITGYGNSVAVSAQDELTPGQDRTVKRMAAVSRRNPDTEFRTDLPGDRQAPEPTPQAPETGPSSSQEERPTRGPGTAKPWLRDGDVEITEAGGIRAGDMVDVPNRTTGRSRVVALWERQLIAGRATPMALIEFGPTGKRLALAVSELRRVEPAAAAQPEPAAQPSDSSKGRISENEQPEQPAQQPSAPSSVVAPPGYVFDEETLHQEKDPTVIQMRGGAWTIVARREQPWSAERGYGDTPDAARRDALRRVGAPGFASAPSAQSGEIQTSAEDWWWRELTGYGRRQATERASVPERFAKTMWQHIPPAVKQKLEALRGTDRDPLAAGSRFETPAPEPRPGPFGPMFDRIEQAHKKFTETLAEIGGLDLDTARKLKDYYLKKRLAKLDAGIGRISVKHGGLLDPEAIKRAVAAMEGVPQKSDGTSDKGPMFAPDRLHAAFTERLRGEGFLTIMVARKIAAEAGFKGNNKQIEEVLEAALVDVAREIVREPGTPQERFDKLVALYGKQPRLGTRTSTSMREQAFSTPVPLAYVASRLAGITEQSTVYEPTAGNGALLIEAKPSNATANEINPQRAASLKRQGFKVPSQDASDPAQGRAIANSEPVDVVIANPPFGAVRQEETSKVFDLSDIQPGYQTHEIDHAIALRALAAMADDGRAVLIIGGPAKTATLETQRSRAYNSKAKREFFKVLYDRYNVTDQFTVAGELYERQGAGWPVDVIVIDGRGKSARALPAVDVPRILTSWDQIGVLANADSRATGRPNANASDGSGQGSRPGNESGAAPSGRGGDRSGGREPGEPGGVQPGTVPGNGVGSPPAGSTRGEPGSVQSEGSGKPRGPDTADDTKRRPSRVEELQAKLPPGYTASDVGGFANLRVDGPNGFGVESNDAGSILKEVRKHARQQAQRPEKNPKDDFDEAFDAALDATFGPQEGPKSSSAPRGPSTPSSRPPRSTADVAKSAASNAAESADAAMSALVQMFGGGKTVSSGIGFDSETYAKAKPLFVKASEKFGAFANDVNELIRRMVGEMQRLYGMTREVLENMRPYLRRFVSDVQSGAIKLGQQEAHKATEPKPRATQQNKEAETETQVAYAPQSGVNAIGTLVPLNMKNSVANALQALEDRVGNLDTFVADELGYADADALQSAMSAEQVDALALGIANIKAGKGFIIGDQTGIGKGRVNAGIIRWAIKNGYVPIFVTEKPNLYGDMYRDLVDIGITDYLGRDPRLVMTNSNTSIPLDDEGKKVLRSPTSSAAHNRLLAENSDPDALKRNYDVVFTTYNQMQTVKSEETQRRNFLRRLAPDAVLIFDESHNAGGQGEDAKPDDNAPADRAALARELIAASGRVFYSSATYAKRPDVMDLYSATDMTMAVAKPSELGEAIARGGVPMQQVVAGMLAQAGQYIRRERSFHGVTYDTLPVAVDRALYDKVSHSLAAIQRFSEAVKNSTKKISEGLQWEAGAVSHDGSTGGAGASSMNFTSIMHNAINQMLLAFKVDPAVKLAIEALERGEKPVITLANTMESFIKAYADDLGLSVGDPVDVDFSRVLHRYLERTRTITIRKPFMKKGEKAEKKYLSDAELGPVGVRLYREAKSLIENMDLSGMPLSPIDKIKADLERAGYKVGEITGRGLSIDYSGNPPVLAMRPGSDINVRGRRRTIASFNSGQLDVIILNQAGSTGLSLHASSKFKDQRRRRMILVQPEGNIDTHMQMLGRIHRTGQVITPSYTQMMADIPAEKRPAAVLAKKMASLNANTTASRGGALTAKDVPDFINAYGDTVAHAVMMDNPDIHRALSRPLGELELSKQDAIRKVTGRIPLLPLKQQEALYETLESEYAELLAQKEAMGENALEAKTLDLQAIPLERTVVVAEKNTSGSPFAAPVTVERVNVRLLGKPYSPAEVVSRVANALGATSDPEIAKGDEAKAFSYLVERALRQRAEQLREEIARFNEYRRSVLDEIEKPDRQEKEQTRLNAVRDQWSAIHAIATPGARVTLRTSDGNLTAIVLKVEQKGKPANPLALSSWKMTAATGDASRQIVVPFSRLFEDGKSDPDRLDDIEIVPIRFETIQDTLNRFQAMQQEAREERFIATGNILAAFDWLNKKGRIAYYTDREGAVRQGIITPRDFELSEHAAKKGNELAPAALTAWLRNNPGKILTSKDDLIFITGHADGSADIAVAAAKRTGGKYFLDDKLTAITGDFIRRGGRMFVNVSPRNVARAVERLNETGARFVDSTSKPDLNTEQVGGADRASLVPKLGVGPQGRLRLARLEQELSDLIERVLGAKARVEFRATLPLRAPPQGWGDYGGRVQTAAGSYSPREGLIRLAMLDPHYTDPRSTAYHEAFHAVEHLIFREQGPEMDLLRREDANLRKWIKANVKFTPAMSGTELANLAGYEVRALAFEGYATMRERNEAVTGILPGIQRAFNRLLQIIRRLRNFLRGYGYRTADDVFSDIFEGRFATGRDAIEPISSMAEAASVRSADDLFKTEAGADGKPQTVIPGTEQSAKQLAAAKGDMKRTGKTQKTVDGLPLFQGEPDPQGSLFSLAQEPRNAEDLQRVSQGFLARGQYLDRAIRVPFDFFGGLTRDGQWKPGQHLYRTASRIITSARFSPQGRFAFVNPMIEVARRGLIDRYGLDPDYVARDQGRALHERAVMLQGAEILKSLKDHAVGPAEAKVLQAILTGETVRDTDMATLAEPIREAIDQLGQEAVALGLVSRESYERNRGAYLHRVYQKHEAEQNNLAKFVNAIMGAKRKKIIGEQLKGRGIFEDVPIARLMKDVAEWHQGARGVPENGERFLMLDEMPNQGEMAGGGGRQRPLRRVWWPANRAIPDRYQGFENRGAFEVRGNRGGKLVLWRDFTKAEREQMGEILDARYTIGKTFMLMAHDLATGRFYKDIAENEAWASRMRPAGNVIDAEEWQRGGARYRGTDAEWVRVPETEIASTGGKKQYGALAGMYVREEIWRDLNELRIASAPSTYRTLLTQWKLNKALALDTPIATPSGWTTMGKIRVGDQVFDEKGIVCEVLEVKDVQHGRPCFDVQFSDGTKITADDEHWWFVTGRNNRAGKVLTTAQIRETLREATRGDCNHAVPVAQALELPEICLPLPPYALGLWLGDGDSAAPRITCSEAVFKEIAGQLAVEGVFSGQARKDRRSTAVTFTVDTAPVRVNCGAVRNRFKAGLRALGVLGTKRIPAAYLRASSEQRRAVLQGLMDSDGWVTSRGTCGYATSSAQLRDDVLELLRSLGHKPTLSEVSHPTGLAWRIHFQAYAEDGVCRLICKRSRLRPRPLRRQRSGTRQIVAITAVASVPVRCIAVSSDSHLYLAGEGMIPTHNTARSPVVHMNNVMSNMVLMDMIDVRFQDLADGLRSFAKGDRHYREAFEHGAFGADMISQEVRDQVLKPILEEIEKQGAVPAARLGLLGQATRFAEIMAKGVKRADQFMKDAYRIEDEVFRMATYMRRRQLGDSPEQAAAVAREQFIDYDIRAPWINAARNSVLPFVSYLYRATPLLARAIATRPWKVAKYAALAYVANALAYAMTGGDEDKERRTLNEKEQGRTPFGIHKMTRLPLNDRYGNPLFLDVRRWMPGGDLLELSETDLPSWMTPGGPLMLGAELVLNRSAFTGKEIFNSKTDDIWGRSLKRADYAYKAWMPSAVWVPGSWYWEKIGNALAGATDRQGRPYSTTGAVASSFGVKVKPHDVEDALAQRGQEFERIERELMAEARRLAGQRERGLVSERAYNRGMDTIMRGMERMRKKAEETFKN